MEEEEKKRGESLPRPGPGSSVGPHLGVQERKVPAGLVAQVDAFALSR